MRRRRLHRTWQLCHDQLVSIRLHRWLHSWVDKLLRLSDSQSFRRQGGVVIGETVQGQGFDHLRSWCQFINQPCTMSVSLSKKNPNLLTGVEQQQNVENTNVTSRQNIFFSGQEPIISDNMEHKMLLVTYWNRT